MRQDAKRPGRSRRRKKQGQGLASGVSRVQLAPSEPGIAPVGRAGRVSGRWDGSGESSGRWNPRRLSPGFAPGASRSCTAWAGHAHLFSTGLRRDGGSFAPPGPAWSGTFAHWLPGFSTASAKRPTAFPRPWARFCPGHPPGGGRFSPPGPGLSAAIQPFLHRAFPGHGLCHPRISTTLRVVLLSLLHQNGIFSAKSPP